MLVIPAEEEETEVGLAAGEAGEEAGGSMEGSGLEVGGEDRGREAATGAGAGAADSVIKDQKYDFNTTTLGDTL